MSRVNEILQYWFADVNVNPEIIPEKQKLWWHKSPDTDKEIKHKFHDDVMHAINNDYREWESYPEGRLALILLLDQFTRCIFRGLSQAFAFDKQALKLAKDGIKKKADKQLGYFERAFFYLPFEHTEDRQEQQTSVDLFSALHAEVPGFLKTHFAGFLDYAKQHKTVIDEFGRFPHRNKLLHRETTSAEQIHLNNHGGF